jgi:hypothetical protein
MIKKSIFVLAALSLVALPFVFTGCAANDSVNWERSESGLGSHPDDDPMERRNR